MNDKPTTTVQERTARRRRATNEPLPEGASGPAGAPKPGTSAPLVVEDVAIERLRQDPANPRKISEAMLERLDRSFAQFGFVSPIVARRADGVVIGGHQRLLVARRRGLASVPVVWLDISTEQAHILGLALNRISGEWDDQLLGRLLAELGAVPELDLGPSGFLDEEIRTLLRSLDAREKRERSEDFDLEAALEEASRTPRSAPGDIWLLGDHRLGCGDATRSVDVERLLGGQKAAMAFTDPPYNVAYGDHGGRRLGSRRRRIANDALDPAAWEAFCRSWASNLLGAVDGAMYICMSSKELATVSRILAEAGGHWSDYVIWHKDRFVLGRSDFQRAFEPIWYGWREGAAHYWCGARDQADVWEIRRPADSPLHPTMKPLELIERALGASSRPGDLVLDLFAGSGSTLVACERTGRRRGDPGARSDLLRRGARRAGSGSAAARRCGPSRRARRIRWGFAVGQAGSSLCWRRPERPHAIDGLRAAYSWRCLAGACRRAVPPS